MSIFNSLKLKVSDYHAEKLKLIDDFDYSNVVWKVNQEMSFTATPEYLHEGIANLKKYYAVALLDPFNEHAVSEMVDPFWHAHILFTQEYHKFCFQIFNQYVHHEPLNPSDLSEVRRIGSLYTYTLETYHKLFNDISEDWWPSTSSRDFKAICSHNALQDREILMFALFEHEPALCYQMAA